MKITRKAMGLGAGAVALGLGAGLAGSAVASIPNSSTGAITGCYVTGDAGDVRIIDKQAGKSCHAYETEVSWPSSSGVTGYSRTTDTLSLPNTGIPSKTVTCPGGKKVTGGGYYMPNTGGGAVPDDVWAPRSYPDTDSSWTVDLKNRTSATFTVTVYAVCVDG